MTLLFLGRRNGAIRAAKALGLRALTITDGPPERRGPRRWAFPFDDPPALAAFAADQPEMRAVRGVLPVKEAAVLPAAFVRETLGLPGPDVADARRCTDKARMKHAVTAAGVACARFVTAEEMPDAASYVETLGLPLVIKARSSSGSRGTRVVRTPDDAPARLPDGWMAEAFVPGVEMSIEALVRNGEVLFENPTEYFRQGWANILPGTPDAATWERVRDLNRRALRALGVRDGITHCEVFVSGHDVTFGELAIRPPGGHLMQLIERAYGFDPWQALLGIALGREPEIRTTPRRTCGVWLLHPGPGRIASIDGIDEARAVPHVVDVPLLRAAGDDVGPREGVGQEIGHILVDAPDRDAAARALETAHAAIRITLADGR